jgi:hypothetical protein
MGRICSTKRKKKNEHMILEEKPEGNRPLRRSTRTLVNDMGMDIKK